MHTKFFMQQITNISHCWTLNGGVNFKDILNLLEKALLNTQHVRHPTDNWELVDIFSETSILGITLLSDCRLNNELCLPVFRTPQNHTHRHTKSAHNLWHFYKQNQPKSKPKINAFYSLITNVLVGLTPQEIPNQINFVVCSFSNCRSHDSCRLQCVITDQGRTIGRPSWSAFDLVATGTRCPSRRPWGAWPK